MTGDGLPAAKGALQVLPDELPCWAWLRRPLCLLPGARLELLQQRLGLDAVPQLYLADAGVLVLLGTRQGRPVVLHASFDATRLQRYAEGLARAQQAMAGSEWRRTLPVVLAENMQGSPAWLAQQRLPGRTLRARGLPAAALLELARQILLPLPRLAQAGDDRVLAADCEALASRLEAIEPWRRELAPALAALRQWVRGGELSSVLVHGDYWLGNLLFDGDDAVPHLSGVLDWERWNANGPAGADALHAVMHGFADWRGGSPWDVLCALWDGVAEPTLEALLQLAEQTLGLRREQLSLAGVLLWLQHLDRHAAERHRWGSQRRQEWFEGPGLSLRRWLLERHRVVTATD